MLSLSEAARKALQISQPTLSRYLRIASISPELGHRLTGHPSADSRTEMLLLAEQTPARQAEIVELLVGGNRRLPNVAAAVAFLDGAPPTPSLTPPERFTQTFSRWRPQEQEAFLDMNAEVVERWLAAKASKGTVQSRKRV